MILNGDHHELGQYVREIADLCGLRDWTVRVDVATADDNHAGECAVTYGRKFGTVRLAEDWASEEPDTVRQTVVHELLHMHTEPIFWAVNNAQDVLGTATFTVLEGGVRDALEVAIDGIATAWAETLPLPVKAEPTRKTRKG